MAEENRQITVGSADLRAALAELELRLLRQLDERLAHKADAAPVVDVLNRVAAMERGDFHPSQRRAIEAVVEERTATKTDQRWDARSRVTQVAFLACSVSGLVISLIVNFGRHG